MTRNHILLFAGVAALAAGIPAQDEVTPSRRLRVGYYGSFPSEAGKLALATLPDEWTDEDGRLGGGIWRITSGGVTPHPLGPGCADVIEMRSAQTKGPHVCLEQGTCGFYLPTRSDGDVAALLRLLGRDVPADLTGEPGPEWTQAAARIRGLGSEQDGLRVGVVAAESGTVVTVLIWNVADTARDWIGTAELVVGDATLSVEPHWPPGLEHVAGRSRVSLDPGSTYQMEVDISTLVPPIAERREDAETMVIEFVMRTPPIDAMEPEAVVRSARVDLPADGDRADHQRAKR